VRFHALATDYEETLAEHGRVAEATLDSLEQVKVSGRVLLLVTGRQLPDLLRAFPRADLFDALVAEGLPR
jgi:phosphoglycolate phosphatase